MNRRGIGYVCVVVAASWLAGCADGDDSERNGGFGTTGGGGTSGGGATDAGEGDGGGLAVQGGEPQIDPEATSFFFSYDESASTASRDLALFAIDNGLRPSASLGRSYEFLNAERFETFDAQPMGPFSVSMTLRQTSRGELPVAATPPGDLYALGVNLQGPTLSIGARRPVVLTLLVDVSGSMNATYASRTRNDVVSLLDVVKHGLTRMRASLKAGDVLNLVTFSNSADIVFENVPALTTDFESMVMSLQTQGSTDIGQGVDLAYDVANRNFDPDKANRVILLTDAQVNTGQLDPERIARETVRGELEGVRLSGIGIGGEFDDRVLNTITEAGKGGYSAMVTPNDAERLFTDGFQRFIDPAATDVRFRLEYPDELDQLRSFGEEISEDPDAVRTVNFSYGSQQFFLELFSGPEALSDERSITLSAEYTSPDGERQTASTTRSIAELAQNRTSALDAAAAVTTLAELIGERLDCETVQASTLYQQPVQDATYALYRQNIQRYCEQSSPYEYFYF